MVFHSWQQSPPIDTPPYTKTSPNIKALLVYLLAVFGGFNLGTYVRRLIRGGVTWSTHAFGAALDWGYGPTPAGRALALRVCDWLIEHHEALGVQMIVDEAFDRTWKVGRGWKDGNVTGGGYWLHIETTPDDWANATPIADRLTATPPPPPPVPPTTPPTPEEEAMPRLIQPADDSAVFLLDGLRCTWVRDGNIANSLRNLGLAVAGEPIIVTRADLSAFELVGKVPVYDPAHSKPGRTLPGDFAAWHP